MKSNRLMLVLILIAVSPVVAQDATYADAEYKKGKDLFNDKNYTAAETPLRNAARVYKQLGEGKNELFASEYLAKCLHSLGRHDDAITLNFELLALASRLNDKTGVGLANNRLGVNYYAKRDYASSLIYFQGALAYYKQSGKAEDKKIALQNVVDCLNKLGKTAEAQSYQAEIDALQTTSVSSSTSSDGPSFITKEGTKIGDPGGSSGKKDGTWADAEYKRAKSLYEAQNYSDAEKVLSEVVDVYSGLGEEKNVLYASEYLAKAYYKLGRYDEAIELNFKLLSLAGKLKDMTGVGLANNRLGLNYYAKRDYSSALIYFQAALAQSRQSGKTEDIKMDLNNVIDALQKLGRTSEANTYMQEVNKLK